MIEMVMFDLDDTLYPEIDFVKSGFDAVSPILSAWLGITREKAMELLWYEFQKDRCNIFNRILERYDLLDINKVLFLVAVFRHHMPVISLFPDASATIIWLRKKGIKIAVLTDGYYFTQYQKVRALRLSYLIDGIVFTDILGRKHWKPDPRGFEMMLARMECPGHRTLYVGDNPLKDFYGARKAGLKTAQIKRADGLYSVVQAPSGYDADCVISSLYQIKTFLYNND